MVAMTCELRLLCRERESGSDCVAYRKRGKVPDLDRGDVSYTSVSIWGLFVAVISKLLHKRNGTRTRCDSGISSDRSTDISACSTSDIAHKSSVEACSLSKAVSTTAMQTVIGCQPNHYHH